MIKVTIEISEEEAACIWANRTIHGRYQSNLTRMFSDVLSEEAAGHKTTFPRDVPRIVSLFRARHPQEPRVQSKLV